MTVETAVVLAAGLGSRLGEGDLPKPLADIHGRSILHRCLDNLASVGVREVAVVVGHRADAIVSAVGDTFAGMNVTYVVSPRFRDTNNSYSLWLARDHLDATAFIVEGDVVFDAEILTGMAAVVERGASAVSALAPRRPGMVGTVADVDGDGLIARLLVSRPGARRPSRARWKTVNLHLLTDEYLREAFLPALERLIDEGGVNEFYERVLAQTVTDSKYDLHAFDCSGLDWCEVDDVGDLAEARYVFGSPAQRLDVLAGHHGSYWRFGVTDHALLADPHFPTPAMRNALAAELPEALVNYPAGQQVMCELVSELTGLPASHLVVANGASELIKALARLLGQVALVVPGFNEYEAVFPTATARLVPLAPPAFELDIDACRRVAAGADALIVSSPNNPTSVAVPRADLIALGGALAEAGVTFVVDESFVDFCPAGQTLEPELLRLPNLVIVKSLSKAYGVGGLRLGYLASSDAGFAGSVRAELPIWNVNGVAESFLRLLPRFQSDFAVAVGKARRACDDLYTRLAAVDGITAVRPDANFVLVRLPEPLTGRCVVERLLGDHGMLVKECAGKSMPEGERYLRISSRTQAENRRLVTALSGVLDAMRAERTPRH